MSTDIHGSTVLVTGGRGFIGQAVCRKLIDRGARPVTVGRRPSEESDALALDLTDPQATLDAVRSVNPDYIIHLASHVVGHRTTDVVASTFLNNTASTVNLLLAAEANGCQHVLLTGSLEEPDPSAEWVVPSSPYAASKLAANAYGRMFAELFDLRVTVMRVFMVYGPGQADTKKLVPYVITSLLRDAPPTFTSGERLVDWVHVDDVANAFVAALEHPDASGKTLDIGSGLLTSVKDVIGMLFALMNADSPPEFGGTPDRALEQVRKANLAPTQNAIDWLPQIELRQGLLDTIDWYRSHPT